MNRLGSRRSQLRNPLGFFSELLNQPAWVAGWVFVLMVINMASLIERFLDAHRYACPHGQAYRHNDSALLAF